MLSHRSIQRCSSSTPRRRARRSRTCWSPTAPRAAPASCCRKIDEAVKLGPALDALIRHKLKVVGVANGQRVPEDWHRLSANALVQRALRGGGSAAWRLDAAE